MPTPPGIAPAAHVPGNALLSPAQLCAVAGAVKGAAVSKAKAELADNSTHPVDLTLRITGHVAKGQAEPGTHGIGPAVVSLESINFFSAVLRRLKVEPAVLRRALKAELKSLSAPADVQLLGQDVAAQALRTEIEQEAMRTAARLPAQPWSRAGRAAAVTSQIHLTVLESSSCPAPGNASANASKPAA